jgi:hypothetical protein
MSILDDAIREHLELKRAHGADDAELKKLEDEAFGPPQRPDEIDPFAEAPTEFLTSPEETAADAPEIGDESERGGRRPDIADLQEPPPTGAAPGPAPMAPPAPGEEGAPPAPEDELSPPPDAPPPSPTAAADVPLPPPPGEAPAADLAPPTGEEPAPSAAEEPATFFYDQSAAPPTDATPLPRTDEAPASPTDEAVAPTDDAPAPIDEAPASPTDEAAAPTDDAPAPPQGEAPTAGDGDPLPPAAEAAAEEPEALADAGPDAEDRQAIADQPTQMFDVQAHVDAEAADEPPTGEQPSPTDEELVDASQEDPQAAPPVPEDAGPPTELYEQPPLESRGPDAEIAGHPPAEAEPEEGSAEFDFFNEQRLSDELDQALEAPLPPTDEHLAMPQYKDAEPEQGGIFDFQSGGETYEEDPSQEVLRRADEAEAAEEPSPDDENDTDYDPETGHEDVLEDTPRFLEDAPEDDDLWFEQKPPKDFDLD